MELLAHCDRIPLADFLSYVCRRSLETFVPLQSMKGMDLAIDLDTPRFHRPLFMDTKIFLDVVRLPAKAAHITVLPVLRYRDELKNYKRTTTRYTTDRTHTHGPSVDGLTLCDLRLWRHMV